MPIIKYVVFDNIMMKRYEIQDFESYKQLCSQKDVRLEYYGSYSNMNGSVLYKIYSVSL